MSIRGGIGDRRFRWLGAAGKAQLSSHLQGLAGVHAVCAQLALHAHVPLMPHLDYGYDIMLDGGIRIQVKSSHLYMGHPAYPAGAYRFSTREQINVVAGKMTRRRPRRDYSKICDFFVFWGIEENRFFIVPCQEMTVGTMYIRRKREAQAALFEKAVSLREKGFSNLRIAEELGVTSKFVQWLLHPNKRTEWFMSFENRWDLLDVNKVSSQIVESVTAPMVLTDAGE